MNIFKRLYYYCPVWQITLILVAFILIVLALLKHIKHEMVRNAVFAFLLLAWFVFCIIGTVIYRTPGSEQGYNFLPLYNILTCESSGQRLEFIRGDLINMLLFFPLGLLLPCIIGQSQDVKFKKVFVITCVVAFMISFAIEGMQFFLRLGYAEVDDLIFNTLGAGIGCLVVQICSRVRVCRFDKN